MTDVLTFVSFLGPWPALVGAVGVLVWRIMLNRKLRRQKVARQLDAVTVHITAQLRATVDHMNEQIARLTAPGGMAHPDTPAEPDGPAEQPIPGEWAQLPYLEPWKAPDILIVDDPVRESPWEQPSPLAQNPHVVPELENVHVSLTAARHEHQWVEETRISDPQPALPVHRVRPDRVGGPS